MEQANQIGISQDNNPNQSVNPINPNSYQTNQHADPINPAPSANPSSIPEFRYASFGRRFLAYCVDSFILFLIYFALEMSFFSNQSFSMNDFQVQSFSNSVNAISMIISLFVSVGYNLIFWVHYNGATPGKKLLAIKILQSNGEKVTYPVAIIRSFGELLSFITIFIGYLWMLWDKKRRTLHDILAGTIVVETNQKPRIGIAIFITSLGCLGMLALFALFVMIVIIAVGSTAKIQESIVKDTSVSQIITQENQSNKLFTQFDANILAEDMSEKINQKRQQNNLVAYKQDQRLCAYAQKRLDYLTSRGDYDGGQGFYEDTANPQIINAYFRDYSLYATNALNLNLTEERSADNLISYWTYDRESIVLSKEFTHSCIKANPQFVVIVTGQKK